MLIQENDFLKAQKEILKNKDKEIIFSSENEETIKKMLEKKLINILLINEKGRKDFQKQRDSGFNHVLAREAKKANIKIGINLDEILEAGSKTKAEILARTKQNVELCKKSKLKMAFLSMKNKDIYDIKALGTVLGMPTWMTKELILINKPF